MRKLFKYLYSLCRYELSEIVAQGDSMSECVHMMELARISNMLRGEIMGDCSISQSDKMRLCVFFGV